MIFDKDKHSYCTDDGKPLISVTQLLRKHGLAPDYGEVDEAVLKAKAERGSLIHGEIADFLTHGEEPMTDEARYAIEWLRMSKAKGISCEQMVGNGIAAGTYDIAADIGGERAIVDWKTTVSYDEGYLSWQLSLYDFLGNLGCSKFLCAQLKPDGITIHEVRRHSDDEISRLLEAEANGQAFISDSAMLAETMRSHPLMEELEKAEEIILFHTKAMEEAKAREERIKEALIDAMENQGVKKLETDRLTITYVAPVSKKTLDSKKLKAERPEIYEEYAKATLTKASVRIAERKEKDA